MIGLDLGILVVRLDQVAILAPEVSYFVPLIQWIALKPSS